MMPWKECLIGGIGGAAWGFTFWLKTERDEDGRMEELEFLKLVRTAVFGGVAGVLLAYAGQGLDLEQISTAAEGLMSGGMGLLLDNFVKIVWRRFGKRIAEKLGFLG